MLREKEETIAAIATPLGEAGIAVVRLSGPESTAVAARVFRGKADLKEVASHTIHFGKICQPTGESIDQVLVSVFRAPHSYTGEESVEISCHGSYYVATKILETVIANGARLADPGEFTKRAFLNGKMDLMQAEAVADLIHSKTEMSHRASMEQLSGRLSKAISELRERLLQICSLLELELDFAEEGIELSDKGRVDSAFDDAITEIKELISSYGVGKLIREGVKVVLAGNPNAGKSSLLNLLLRENRAIVSEQPGTTRDVIEESIVIHGVAFRLVDTAGLRSTRDAVEQEGVRRSSSQIEAADLILLIVDSSIEGAIQDPHLTEILQQAPEKMILVFNKVDLLRARSSLEAPVGIDSVNISCETGEGIQDLVGKIYRRAIGSFDSVSSSIKVQNARHLELLRKTSDSLISAKKALEESLGGELVAIDLHAALNSLGEIAGLTTPDDVLNSIFSRFCIGK
ncbi:MAG TPA: tRNA uridine-5-carboxymethylaminomethyl(34) synthesis GTPase MnmE [Bacteroidota bacterium]|nr:tRNA uridine-5-carboxymethylaminomethyl(34) synthesis GTPase MnmE [Bacteroidota bacterium]